MAETTQSERRGAFLLNFFGPLFGRHLSYVVASIVVLFYFLTYSERRRSIIEFHKNLGAKNHLLATWRSYKNYLYFSATLIDRVFHAKNGTAPEIKIIGDMDSLPKGAILVGSHFGDWTLCGKLFAERLTSRLAILVDLAANPKFQKRIMSQISKQNLSIIDASQDRRSLILSIRDAITDGENICFLGDRLSPSQKYGDQIYLGKTAKFPLSAFDTAQLFKAPVFAFFCTKEAYSPRAPYTFHLIPLNKDLSLSAEACQALFVKHLEESVRKSPYNWFNFFPFWS